MKGFTTTTSTTSSRSTTRHSVIKGGILLLLLQVLLANTPFVTARAWVSNHKYPSTTAFHSQRLQSFQEIRGGSQLSEEEEEEDVALEEGQFPPEEEEEEEVEDYEPEPSRTVPPTQSVRTRTRKTSDIILDLTRRSGVELAPESQRLRKLFIERKHEMLQEDDPTQISAKRLLHILAPKIPAIQTSPDITLRITSSNPKKDSGLAASLMATLAHVVVLQQQQTEQKGSNHNGHKKSAAQEVVSDRRFQQLVECVICGLESVEPRRKSQKVSDERENDDASKSSDDEANKVDESDMLEDHSDDETDWLLKNWMEHHQMDHTQTSIQDGICVRDACRAAWGLVVLGAHKQQQSSSESNNSKDSHHDIPRLLKALSFRVRDLLLGRIQLLCLQDLAILQEDYREMHGTNADDMTATDILVDLAEEIAEDAATALWAFGCVQSLTGIGSPALLEVCSHVLVQNPLELREQVQQRTSPQVIGSNDVVEKLALADDEQEESKTEVASAPNSEANGISEAPPLSDGIDGMDPVGNDQKDQFAFAVEEDNDSQSTKVLVDMLDPSEISDILWALASHADAMKDDAEFSETVTLLCDICFDRVLYWLNEDVHRLEQHNLQQIATGTPKDSSKIDSETIQQEEDSGAIDDSATEVSAMEMLEETSDNSVFVDTESTMPGKVMDAAAILAAEKAGICPEETETASTEILEAGKTMDASAILAAEAGSMSAADISTNVDDDLLPEDGQVADVPIEQTTKGFDETHLVENDLPQPIHLPPMQKLLPADITFGSSELCCIAWAVTELKDSIRNPIIEQICNIVVGMGPSFLRGRSASALANLAQAVSKVIVENGDVNSENLHTTLRWIADEAIFTVTEAKGSENASTLSERLLDHFHPPLLSQLLISMASAANSLTEQIDSTKELASIALDVVAVDHQSLCGTEDMARIAFAYLELVYPTLSDEEKNLADCKLGKIFCLIELALLQWELSPVRSTRKTTQEPKHFLSFFGKSWSNIAKFERRSNDVLIESEESDYAMPTLLDEKSSKLPQLRDFPIDPSTLSKLTWSSSRLSRVSSAIDSLARVALRLFTSRNGRLLRECSVYDLANIVRAANNVKAPLRELVGLFARRVVKVLNEASGFLESSPPLHVAALLFSLGRLGVKYGPYQDPSSAHRRLQLVAPLPIFGRAVLGQLPPQSILFLLRASGLLEVLHHDTRFVANTLSITENSTASIFDSSARGLVEAVGNVMESAVVQITKMEQTTNSTRIDDGTFDEMPSVTETDLSDIKKRCRTLLEEIGTSLLNKEETVAELSATDMRRILYVYATIPVQADTFIQLASLEIEKRINRLSLHSAIDEPTNSRMTAEDLENIAENANFVKTILIGDDDEHQSAFGVFKERLASFFGAKETSELGEADDMEGLPEGFNDEDALSDDPASTYSRDDVVEDDNQDNPLSEDDIRQALNCIIDSSDRHAVHFRQKEQTRNDAMDENSLELAVGVELGRCQELIAYYHRHDFESGVRLDRVDVEDRRFMTKQMISRLLP